jgi:hypothetical protein
MVEITQAEGLPLVPLRIPSKKVNCNTFVEVQCGDEKFTTDTFRHTQKPTYNKVHTFTLNESISDNTPPLKVKDWSFTPGEPAKPPLVSSMCPSAL